MAQFTVGVCSWSLEPGDSVDLIARVRAVALDRVQLALDPIRTGLLPRDLGARLAQAGITVGSGMIAMEGEDYRTPASIRRTGGVVPDDTWDRNWSAAQDAALLARELGLDLVTFHAGFIPHEKTDRTRSILIGRLRELADLFGANGVRVGLETGQEKAECLLELLHDLSHPAVGINFDPANMILYGMGDPVAALRLLAPEILQVHVKDALPPRREGEWGTEVPVGSGAVDWAAFFAAMSLVPRAVELMVEREAGTERVTDIAQAVRFLHHIGIAFR